MKLHEDVLIVTTSVDSAGLIQPGFLCLHDQETSFVEFLPALQPFKAIPATTDGQSSRRFPLVVLRFRFGWGGGKANLFGWRGLQTKR